MRSQFPTTQWTHVLRAAEPESTAERGALAERYWFPLYAYARARGLVPASAEDAVQAFLTRLLVEGGLSGIEREGGCFRDFLRKGIENELRDMHRAANAAKRRPAGGLVSWEEFDPEERYSAESIHSSTPERLFDRLVAMELLEVASARLREEFEGRGESELFSHLMGNLDRDPDRETHAEASLRLRCKEGTLRNKAVAFRERFHDVFRQVVAETVADPARVDDEIRNLIDGLSP